MEAKIPPRQVYWNITRAYQKQMQEERSRYLDRKDRMSMYVLGVLVLTSIALQYRCFSGRFQEPEDGINEWIAEYSAR